MSVATHDEESWPTPASMVRALLRAVTTAIEAHARYRVNSAISPSRFQQADREIRRCRRLMRAGR
jgi:hypothetical protein